MNHFRFRTKKKKRIVQHMDYLISVEDKKASVSISTFCGDFYRVKLLSKRTTSLLTI